MSSTKIPLSLVSVASPCTASWDAMSGDDTARFCGQCAQYVYNLSEMTEKDAEALIMEHEGTMCVRYYKRFDGTMMTKDCPVGWRAIKRRVALVGGAAAALIVAAFSLLTLGAFAASVRGNGRGGVEVVNPITRICDILFPRAVAGGMEPLPPGLAPPGDGNQPDGNQPMVMGAMCPPPRIQPLEPPPPPEPPLPIEDLKK